MRLALVAVAPLVVLAMAGCSANESSRPPANTPAAQQQQQPAADPGQRSLQFARCMREHGVDMPDPDPGNPGQIKLGGPGTDQRKTQEAVQACRQFAPIGNGPSGAETPEQNAARLKFARCMREHGVEDWPDPSGAPSGPVMNDSKLTDDPDFEAAAQACAPLLREAFGDTF